jgi:hypothetical protein
MSAALFSPTGRDLPSLNSLAAAVPPSAAAAEAWLERLRATDGACEWLTTDYITALARYLGARAAAYGLTRVHMLELGAGAGALTHFLARELTSASATANAAAPSFVFTCCDDFSRPAISPYACVQRISTERALAMGDSGAHGPVHMCLCAWMPFGVDWTADMRRRLPSLREYVLIGHRGAGIQGCALRTWGFDRGEPLEDGSSDGSSDSSDSSSSDDDDESTSSAVASSLPETLAETNQRYLVSVENDASDVTVSVESREADGADDEQTDGWYVPLERRAHHREGFRRVDLETDISTGFRCRQLCRFDTLDDWLTLASWPRRVGYDASASTLTSSSFASFDASLSAAVVNLSDASSADASSEEIAFSVERGFEFALPLGQSRTTAFRRFAPAPRR